MRKYVNSEPDPSPEPPTEKLFEFHYVPDEGVLPGLIFEQQTEDVINDVGNYAYFAQKTASKALKTGIEASTTARTALNAAQNAQSTADRATELGNTGISKADAAQETGNKALEKAETNEVSIAANSSSIATLQNTVKEQQTQINGNLTNISELKKQVAENKQSIDGNFKGISQCIMTIQKSQRYTTTDKTDANDLTDYGRIYLPNALLHCPTGVTYPVFFDVVSSYLYDYQIDDVLMQRVVDASGVLFYRFATKTTVDATTTYTFGDWKSIDTRYLKLTGGTVTGQTTFSGKLTASGETSVPTPSTENNSKTIANTEFVHGVVSNLVNGAPNALDTLQELATALGNDPNFSTTILNKIGDKESKTDAQIEYKKLHDAIPTKVSQLLNDSGYQKTTEIPVASQTQNGYMSASDKAKLDKIAGDLPDVTDYIKSVTESNGKVTVTKGNGDSTTFNAGYTSPTEYRRAELPVSDKTTITINKTRVVINGHLLETTGNVLSLSQNACWDSETYVIAANRAGKDFYIYACIPDSGTEPKFMLSANSTVPTGYTADNSRKIGGFHCLCASVGTISGHSLSGYITGDILPASVWDLLHRCKGENEGMVYDAYDDVWIGIYLLSYDNGRAVSRFNGVILDSESTPKTHGLWFTETLAKQKMRLPYLHEFFNALKGCQERVNISGSKDWNTTGGHVYTNNVRCISNIGLEDPTGFMWQWSNNYGMAGGSGWGSSAYDSQVDSVNCGGTYGSIWLPRIGGGWSDGSNCGSRSGNGGHVAASCYARNGARPASEPRVVIL